ncbi:nuclear transport factor 2 family protein [Streptomyces sp. NPDC017890]|uniref:nuclear transport factor 2 family protein n=1 Tax=Streptomyces sp. NPDC017890 TaxID=3365015 RepID=UPI0037B5A9D5
MNTSPRPSVRMELVDAYRDHLRAMAEGDTAALDTLLDDGFTLTHTMGHEQPKAEWLAQMRSGHLVYHDIDEKTVTVRVDGDTARVVGRLVADATVDGSHCGRRLQLTMDYARVGATWTALRSVARSW